MFQEENVRIWCIW